MLQLVGNGRNMLEIIVSQQIETFNLKTAPIIMTISSEEENSFNFLQSVAIFPITEAFIAWEDIGKDT